MAATGRRKSSHPREVALIRAQARFGDNGNSMMKRPRSVTFPLLYLKDRQGHTWVSSAGLVYS